MVEHAVHRERRRMKRRRRRRRKRRRRTTTRTMCNVHSEVKPVPDRCGLAYLGWQPRRSCPPAPRITTTRDVDGPPNRPHTSRPPGGCMWSVVGGGTVRPRVTTRTTTVRRASWCGSIGRSVTVLPPSPASRRVAACGTVDVVPALVGTARTTTAPRPTRPEPTSPSPPTTTATTTAA